MNDGITQDDLNEDCPILMQKDFQTTIKNIAELPDYLRKINENIINIDKRISKKELNTDKVKQLNTHYSSKENNSKCGNDLYELNNLVKQSIDGLYDILGGKKDPRIIEIIEEENINKEDIELKAIHKISNKTKNKENNSSLHNKKNFKKPITHSKTTKTSTNKGDSNIQINKVSANTNSKTTIAHLASTVQKKYTQKNEPNTDILLNNTYNTIFHLTSEQSLKNIANSRGLASTNDIKSNVYINNNSDIINTVKSTSVYSKESNKNTFSFKPRMKKDSSNGLNDASISSEPQKKVVTSSMNKENTVKINQIKAKGVNSLHQRLLTEQSKPSSNKNTSSALKQQDKLTIARNNQTTQSKSNQDNINGATTQDILRLMLFFNEYIMSNSSIKSSTNNKESLETISLTLAKALKSIGNDQYNTNTNIEASSMDRGDFTMENEKMIDSVLKLQRKWRRYKVKEIILNSSQDENEKSLIKAMIVNNFIEKEGFGAKKLIGMINSSIESFLLLNSNINLFNYNIL